MGTIDYNEELKKVKVIFIINLVVSVICLAVVFNSIGDGAAWRVTCSAIGFAGIAGMTTLLFVRLKKLQKLAKERR